MPLLQQLYFTALAPIPLQLLYTIISISNFHVSILLALTQEKTGMGDYGMLMLKGIQELQPAAHHLH